MPWAASWLPDHADVRDCADFLLARLGEDEQAARAATPTPARVLADVETKRGIVMRYRLMMAAEPGEHRSVESIRTEQLVLAEMIRRLAAVYADHPDYLFEWRRA